MAALAAASPLAAQCPTSASQWRRWECVLTSTNDYLTPSNQGNPYRDVELKVTYSNLSTGETFSTYGFWDGDTVNARKIFKIRGAFPPGTWNWSTTCKLRSTPPALMYPIPDCLNDTGLTRSGTITVQGVIVGDGNELYNRGFLKVAPGGSPRYLVYGSGVRFYWLGDTAWAASMAATTGSDFQTYIDDRAFRSQVQPAYPPFTVIQMAPAPMWAGQRDQNGNVDLQDGIPIDFQNRRPFEKIASCAASGNPPNNCSRSISAYWRDFEQKVENANKAGLAVFLAGVMNPLGEDGAVIVPPTEEAKIFARHIVARLFGNFVIFSPGFDARPNNFSSLINAVGCAIEKASCVVGTPATACNNGCKGSRHLITDHPGGGSSLTEIQSLQGQPWLSFQMFQSGHCSSCATVACQLTCMADRARALPLGLQGTAPIKPDVNGEAIYEGTTQFSANSTAYRTRQMAYLSVLSGAFGYSFGVCGVFEWGHGASCPGGPAWQPTSAITRESSKQMRYLANTVQSVAWERLVGNQTEHDRITNQNAATPAEQKMVLARDGNNAVLAYLPKEQTQIDLALGVLTGFPANWTSQWCNPRTGACSTATPSSLGGGSYRFTRPASCGSLCDVPDWVLKLVNTTSSSTTATGLEVWTVADPELGGSRIVARLRDPSGLSREDPFEVSSGRGFARFPQAAKDGGGVFTIVWQSDMQDGELGGIFARRFDPQGRPLSEEFQVNTATAGDQLHPSVTAGASGEVIVVWSNRDPNGEGTAIAGRLQDRQGSWAGAELGVNSTRLGVHDFARVAANPAGDFVVAWEYEASDGSGSAILAQIFDRSGRKVGPELRVSGSSQGRTSLASVDMSPAGEVLVSWEKFGVDSVTLGRFGQRFSRSGTALGGEFPISSGG